MDEQLNGNINEWIDIRNGQITKWINQSINNDQFDYTCKYTHEWINQ